MRDRSWKLARGRASRRVFLELVFDHRDPRLDPEGSFSPELRVRDAASDHRPQGRDVPALKVLHVDRLR